MAREARPRRRFLAAALALAAWPAPARADEALWQRLRGGGLVILVRHAATEAGLGDPSGYSLEDCATQRNLSAAGRAQAQRLGERLRAAQVPVDKVYTSPWCRCRETARLAFGEAEDWTPLGSFFDAPHLEARYSESVRRRIGALARGKGRGGNVVMVTHHVNIRAVTGIAPAPGEMVVVRPDGCCALKVVGRLAP